MSDERILTGVVVAAILMVAALFYVGLKDHDEHVEYVAKHRCVEISRKPQAPIMILQQVGNVQVPQFIPQPDRVTYECNNGMYVR